MMYHWFHLTAFIWLPNLIECINEFVVVETKSGKIRGIRATRKYGLGEVTETVDNFLGIPYAKPPLGNLRFENPTYCTPWSHIRNATNLPPRCPQPLNPGAHDDRNEDCLYLNIHSPFEREKPAAVYPVMLYIHGGSYSSGAGSDYDGHVLAQYGVVVVTLNYRLGALGFLTSGDSEMPGNYGIFDQIFAMKWIQDNILKFRGDPGAVTLFGNSAGGASVGLHILSPLSKGLFHRGVIESGAMNSFWAVHKQSANLKEYLFYVGKIVNCRYGRTKEILDCLKKTPWVKFIENRFPRITPSATDLKPWIDGKLLPTNLELLMRSGMFNKVPIMAGTTKHEWAKNMGWFLEDFEHDLHDFSNGFDRAAYELALEYVATNRFEWPKELVDVILFEYTNWTHINDPLSNREQYMQFFTDIAMVAPTVKMSKYFVKSHLPVFFYSFDYIRESAIPKTAPESYEQEHMRIWAYNYSYHESELNYLFGGPFSNQVIKNLWIIGNYTDTDRTVSRRMMKLWSNFAKFGDPTAKPESIENIRWEKFQDYTTDHLVIDAKNCTMHQHLRLHWVTFWNKLVPNLLRKMRDTEILLKRRSYDMEMWSFVGLSIFLSVLVVVLTIFLCRNQRNIQGYRYQPPPTQV